MNLKDVTDSITNAPEVKDRICYGWCSIFKGLNDDGETYKRENI